MLGGCPGTLRTSCVDSRRLPGFSNSGHRAAPRFMALSNLARADTTLKASLKGKRKYAGWDDVFMAALIAG